MPKFSIDIKPIGSQVVLIIWPQKIEDAILEDIIQFTKLIVSSENDDLINHTPGYNSLLLQYTSTIDFEKKKTALLSLYSTLESKDSLPSKTWHIPVCYDPKFGVDLSIFEKQGLSVEETVALHTAKPYRVYMIGFLPGFLYLGQLPKALHQPRKPQPRLKVSKGSIAIGGEQTGIYPMDSPGGWQIIGRTPLTLFDLNQEESSLIQQGDYIQFYPVDLQFYECFDSH